MSFTRTWYRSWLVLLCLVPLALAGCSGQYAENPIAERETLAQVSTLDALMGGLYDGEMSFGTLKGYGDMGLGTFEALDGEMLGFDGEFYQVRADGSVHQVPDSMETPFACVTFFDVDETEGLPQGTDYAGLEQLLDGMVPTDNIFYAIRIDGTFSSVKARSVPRQERPYPPLADVIEEQVVFELTDVAGTMVGFRCPAYVDGLNAVGYHLHFLTEDRDAGGHVLEFQVTEAVASLDYTSEYLLLLPGPGSDFYSMELPPDTQE